MRKILSQIIYQLKKDKSSYISFGIIVLVTAFMLNCAATLLLQVDKAYDKKFENLHTASVNVCIPKFQDNAELSKAITEMDGVTKVESHEAILAEVVVKKFQDADFSMNTMFYNLDAKRCLNCFEIKAESEKTYDNPIYISLYVAEFGEFSLGEEIVYVIEGTEYRFTVAGIIEEMQYGNYGSGLMCTYLPEEEYLCLYNELENSLMMEYSLSLNENAELDKIKTI